MLNSKHIEIYKEREENETTSSSVATTITRRNGILSSKTAETSVETSTNLSTVSDLLYRENLFPSKRIKSLQILM